MVTETKLLTTTQQIHFCNGQLFRGSYPYYTRTLNI